jgi:hypothetical protein
MIFGGIILVMGLNRKSILQSAFFLLALASVFACGRSAFADAGAGPSAKTLLEKYPLLESNLVNNQFGVPIYLESKDNGSLLHVDLYSILDYPFDGIKEAIQSPSAWCDITSLMLNIKASTCCKVSDQWHLTIYTGKKNYQPPKDAYKQDFNFHVAALEQDYLDIVLSSKDGPFFTKNHMIRFEAAPLDAKRTFMHFAYDYTCGFFSRAAIKAYYETIGHDKKGFSIIASDKNGDPVYQCGIKGAEERNAVRCYLGIRAYMDTLKIAVDHKFEEQLNRWYDMTQQFPLQLHEEEKGEYLDNKRREHNNQLTLQKEANKG